MLSFKSENQNKMKAKLFITLIAILFACAAVRAQGFDLRGQETTATSYKAGNKFLKVTLPNTNEFREGSFAFVRGDKQYQTCLFVCMVTPTEIHLTSIVVGTSLPLRFENGESVYICPLKEGISLESYNIDISGLREQCRAPK
jgi:hypothetical protein